MVAMMHQFQRRRGLYFFQMSLNGVCIRSVFEQKIGPYKVCIFVNMGPSGKVAALCFHTIIGKPCQGVVHGI